jgi:hypothetical protein
VIHFAPNGNYLERTPARQECLSFRNGCDTTNPQTAAMSDGITTCTIYSVCTAGNYPYALHGPRTADLNGRRADWGHDERKADDGLRTARMVPIPPAG